MSTKKIHDLSVVTGKYQGTNGEQRNKYLTIGAMFEKDDGGRFIILEPHINLAGIPHEPGRGIMVSMYDIKPQDGCSYGPGSAPQSPAPASRAPTQGRAPAKAQAAAQDDFTDDIPF